MGSAVFFVDRLTLRTWAFSVWPRLLLGRLGQGRSVSYCYVIDASRFTLMMAKASARCASVTVERLIYGIADMRDESGLSIRLRLLYHDLAEVQQCAMAEPVFREVLGNGLLKERLPIFLAKKLASTQRHDQSNIWRALHLVQACNWKKKQELGVANTAVLFLERQPWLGAITRYASDYGVAIVPVRPSLNVRSALRRCIPRRMLNRLRYLRYRRYHIGLLRAFHGRAFPIPVGKHGNQSVPLPGGASAGARERRPMVAVDYYGRLNLNHPERHSVLFFWQQSSLAGSDVLLIASHSSLPIDGQCWSELREHRIEAVALHPGATRLSEMPVVNHRWRTPRSNGRKRLVEGKGPEAAWLNREAANYQEVRAFWVGLASAYNIKVFVTWYKYDETHCAIADGLQAAGGVTAIYQRAYEALPSAEATIGADIVFGFSQRVADVERGSNSRIRYHVATGYIGDHRFPLLRNAANAVRERLCQHGAKHILAYFDENSHDDVRWGPGHRVTQANYAFLLEKVLAEPGLGLVIKPKVPGTLRRRLGPVARMLDAAEATGRCYVYSAEDKPPHGWHPPAEAALSADIAIHGHLASATAGMEAALTGVPTLLLDGEGWPVSPLYRLGVGTVAFTDWEKLWNACQQHWSSPGGIPGFGDWTPMLDEIDPFRDGRAAERMGTYLQWLIEGFRDGRDRERVMADAAERYCAIWGRDKITEVNSPI